MNDRNVINCQLNERYKMVTKKIVYKKLYE